MIQIRHNTFETNSSSTHSMTIFTAEQFREFKRGDLWVNDFYGRTSSEYKGKQFVTLEEIEDILQKSEDYQEDYESLIEAKNDSDELSEWVYDHEDSFINYERMMESDYLEVDENEYTSPSGDNLVMVCRYGFDG